MDPKPQQSRVLVIEPERLLLDTLATCLGLERDLAVVGATDNVADGVRLAESGRPHIVLVDLHHDAYQPPLATDDPIGNQLRQAAPQAKVAGLSGYADPRLAAYLIRLHELHGYLLKQTPLAQLLRDLRSLRRRPLVITASIADQVLEELVRGGLPILSDRQRIIVRLAARGLSNRSIAEELSRTEGAVAVRLHEIYELLQLSGIPVHNRVELANWARRVGYA